MTITDIFTLLIPHAALPLGSYLRLSVTDTVRTGNLLQPLLQMNIKQPKIPWIFPLKAGLKFCQA